MPVPTKSSRSPISMKAAQIKWNQKDYGGKHLKLVTQRRQTNKNQTDPAVVLMVLFQTGTRTRSGTSVRLRTQVICSARKIIGSPNLAPTVRLCAEFWTPAAASAIWTVILTRTESSPNWYLSDRYV